MEITESPTSVFVIAVLVAVVCQIASSKIKFPPIFLWLLAGMALGPFGIHILHPEMVRAALHTLIELGLAVILFEGGLNLNLKSLKEHGWVVGRLLTFGPLLTITIGGAAAHYLTGMEWPLSLLFGALIAVGGPTVITPILRQVRLDREIAHILSSEAMLVDAVGAILAIVMLQLVLIPDPTILSTVQTIIMKFSVGAAFGFAGGWLLSRILKSSIIDDIEARTVFTLAAVWGLFLLADGISSQTGLLAVLIAGATMQKMELPDIQRLRHFKGSLSILLISVLFVLLAANLNLGIIRAHLWEGLAIFLILALIARPLSTWLAAIGSELTAPQVWFLAGMAPRGVVAAGITSLFVIILIEADYKEAEVLLALVYIIIIASVFVYSFLASPLAQWLAVTGRDERSVLIVGGGQMGAELGRVLAEEREVRFLDLNAEVVKNLKRANFQAVCGNALDPIYMEILHTEEVSAVLAMTGSSDHNLLIANLARDTFHVSEVYVALQEGDEIKHASMIRQLQARRLFAKPYTFSYWHDQALRKRLMHETRIVEPESELIGHRMADARIPHGIQPLALCRDGKMMIPHDDLIFEAGDEISLLLRPERIQEGQALVLPPASDNSMVITKKTA
ncbi:MAG: cation:proton antiporter [Mariprofundaceae bacterium]|nr:cation:proton antiporter [Mariprofundaceae bacterium]